MRHALDRGGRAPGKRWHGMAWHMTWEAMRDEGSWPMGVIVFCRQEFNCGLACWGIRTLRIWVVW